MIKSMCIDDPVNLYYNGRYNDQYSDIYIVYRQNGLDFRRVNARKIPT